MSVKKLLYDYPSYKQAIHNMREQKLKLDGLIERSYPNGIGNYSQELPNYNTNVITSTTENHAIKNIIMEEKEIGRINHDIEELQRVVYAIERALKSLRSEEKEIIELRYFKKKTWAEIEELGHQERTAKRIGSRALDTLNIELRYIKPIGTFLSF